MEANLRTRRPIIVTNADLAIINIPIRHVSIKHFNCKTRLIGRHIVVLQEDATEGYVSMLPNNATALALTSLDVLIACVAEVIIWNDFEVLLEAMSGYHTAWYNSLVQLLVQLMEATFKRCPRSLQSR